MARPTNSMSKQRSPDFFSQATSSCSLPFPSQPSLRQILNLPRGLLPRGHAWNTSPRKYPGGILVRCPNHFNWLWCGGAGALLSLSKDWAPLPISKEVHSHPLKETHFRHFYLQPHSFCYYWTAIAATPIYFLFVWLPKFIILVF